MVRYILISIFMVLPNLLYASNIENSYIVNDDFTEKIKELLINKLNLQNANNANLNIEFSAPSIYPMDSQEIDKMEITYFSMKNYSFNLQVIMKNGRHFFLYGKYYGTIGIPVTNQYIKFGNLLTTNNLVLQHITLEKILGTDYLINIDDIIGMEARRNLPCGIALRAKDLANPIVIRPKDKVTIIYSGDNLEIKILGIAIDKGGIGDNVKIKNEKTGKILHGVILDSNIVQVNK